MLIIIFKNNLINTQTKILQKGTKMHKGTNKQAKRIFIINNYLFFYFLLLLLVVMVRYSKMSV